MTFVYSDDVSKTMVDQFRTWQRSDQPPSLIVASTGLRLLRTRNTTTSLLEEYQRNLTRLVQAIDSLAARNTQVLWKLMEPVDAEKLKNENKKITNANIDAYNRAAVQILTHSAAKVWESARLMWSAAQSPEGAALGGTALRHSAQVLLNMFCNDHMNFNDGSCCAQPEPHSQLQVLTFAVFFACAALAGLKSAWHWSQTVRQRLGGYALVSQQPPPSEEPSPLVAIAKLGMIMSYFYLCDRTNFFMKENKYYSEWSFWLPVGYVFALGLFFTEDSKSTRVLHREQTLEWKGWMQIVILIYQVTGASKVLPIYMLVRTLVSSYLFLTGYGHFYYTWKTGDTSLVRYLRVMFRLNFLTVVLCLTMNRPYQFYSFVPLVSFWYTLMFVIFALPPHIAPSSTHTVESKPYQYLYIAAKIIGLLVIVTVLYLSEVFFQKIFVTRPWKALFVNSDDDIHQWWLMWKQDRYSVAYGMMFALLYLLGQRHGLLEEGARGPLVAGGGALAGALLAALGLGAYGLLVALCSSPAACDEIHSYAACVPLASYAALRNLCGGPRAKHSALFAAAGRVALELYASVSHAWLAADTHGVLVLLPAAPGLNLLLTSYVFACAAHETHRLTLLLLPRAVPDDWRLVLRNLAIFLAVLVPIGMYDGMF